MIIICGNSLRKPLEMFFKPCITKGEFSSKWKKASAVPVHKKRQAFVKELHTDVIAANLWQKF